MGAFLLLRRRDEARHREPALLSLERQGFREPRRFETPEWSAYVCGKYSGDPPSWYFHDDRNFGFCCGTFFYGAETGSKALERLSRDMADGRTRSEDIQGSFCAVLCRQGQLELMTDGAGVYKVYHDPDFTVVSSSFLAVLATVARPAVDKQSVYEYVFQGATYDGRTVIEQVRLLAPRAALRLGNPPSVVPPPALSRPAALGRDLGRHVALIHEELRRRFQRLVECFGSDIDTALSGGYDSRLLLALLREQGVRPRVHVYGGAHDLDVALAKAIAAGEGFSLTHIDKAKAPLPALEEFPAVVARNFWSFDGYPADGIIDGGVDRMTRSERAAAGVLALNGGGGEIFRNFFYLPDRRYTVRQLLYAFFSQFDPAVCSAAFIEEEYLGHLAVAVARLLGFPQEARAALAQRLERSEIELLYAYFRCSFWMGRNNSVNNRFGYFTTPFIEPGLIALAAAVPLGLKNHGILEARLIAAADPALARYPSSYGESFARAPSLRRRLGDASTLLRPVGLRRLSYRLQNRWRREARFPRLLQGDYLARVLDPAFPQMRRYFNVDRILSAAEMNRICTLEYLFGKYEPAHSSN